MRQKFTGYAGINRNMTAPECSTRPKHSNGVHSTFPEHSALTSIPVPLGTGRRLAAGHRALPRERSDAYGAGSALSVFKDCFRAFSVFFRSVSAVVSFF